MHNLNRISESEPRQGTRQVRLGVSMRAVWLHHVCSLSQQTVELLLLERMVAVSQETVGRWRRKSGQSFANCVGRRRLRSGDNWHRDEVFSGSGVCSDHLREQQQSISITGIKAELENFGWH